MDELEPRMHDEANALDYVLVGDYYSGKRKNLRGGTGFGDSKNHLQGVRKNLHLQAVECALLLQCLQPAGLSSERYG
ncbi:hypothetical protein D3Z58_11995 [Clostridiaceae bacterium]|mgnify:CR=1 FL=1|nr:hypothetical protein [Clostridiaceae bacterium]